MSELDLFTNQTNCVRGELSFDVPMSNKIETFYEKIKPVMNNRQEAVWNTVSYMNRPVTMHEVAEEMKVPLNTISGRFGELVKKNKLQVVGRTPDKKSLYRTLHI